MLRPAAIACSLFIGASVPGQNLIPNPGFERYDQLPDNEDQLGRCHDWHNPSISLPDHRGTPDYFHIDAPPAEYYDVSPPTTEPAFTFPHSGDAMIGMIIHYDPLIDWPVWREYATAQLTQPLVPGKRYLARFHITSGGSPCAYARASSGFSILLTTYMVAQQGSQIIPRPPQYIMSEIFYDTTWRAFDVALVVDSAYRYITYGNFRIDGATPDSLVHRGQEYDFSYVFLDDVSLVRYVDAGPDTMACLGRPLTLHAAGGYTTAYWWEYPFGDTLAVGSSVTVAPIGDMTLVLHEGDYSDTMHVHAVPPPVIDLGPDIATCDSQVVLTQAVAEYVDHWSTGHAGPTLTVTSDGWYWVDAGNGFCSVRDSVHVRFDRPLVDLGSDRSLCQGDTLVLDAGYPEADHTWSTGGSSRYLPITSSGTYSVQVDRYGCTGADTVQVSFDPGVVGLTVPNVITPNNDGVNDRLVVGFRGTTYDRFALTIMDRWGSVVFRSMDPTDGWDGDDAEGASLPAGAYFYTLEIAAPCGVKERTGHVMLLR